MYSFLKSRIHAEHLKFAQQPIVVGNFLHFVVLFRMAGRVQTETLMCNAVSMSFCIYVTATEKTLPNAQSRQYLIFILKLSEIFQ